MTSYFSNLFNPVGDENAVPRWVSDGISFGHLTDLVPDVLLALDLLLHGGLVLAGQFGLIR